MEARELEAVNEARNRSHERFGDILRRGGRYICPRVGGERCTGISSAAIASVVSAAGLLQVHTLSGYLLDSSDQ
jgi:hypothetical protein